MRLQGNNPNGEVVVVVSVVRGRVVCGTECFRYLVSPRGLVVSTRNECVLVQCGSTWYFLQLISLLDPHCMLEVKSIAPAQHLMCMYLAITNSAHQPHREEL